MKTTNNTRADLRKYPKYVRQAIAEIKSELNKNFYKDLGELLNGNAITKEGFINLFKKHLSNDFIEGSIDIDNITFKKDNTPDHRSLPKGVREILKSFEKEDEQKKKDYVTKALSNVSSLSIGVLNDILEKSKENTFQQKWITPPSKELVTTKEEDFYSRF